MWKSNALPSIIQNRPFSIFTQYFLGSNRTTLGQHNESLQKSWTSEGNISLFGYLKVSHFPQI